MFGLLIRLVISTVAVLIAANVLPGIQVANLKTAVIVAVVLGLLNTFVKPVLKILTFPITLLTLGLFLLVINVIIVYLADYLVSGFTVSGFLSALIFSFVLSIVSSLLGMFLD